MASVNSVPDNEGISVKNENDDPEINAMALEMKVPLVSSSIITPSKDNIDKLKSDESNDREDIESFKGRFGWEDIGSCCVPYIVRIINNECEQFVSVRIAESQLLSNYLNCLHADIYTCTSVRSHFITDTEAKLLNDLNRKHAELMYGKELFFPGKDYIVRFEDVQEFYAFLDVCYNKLLCNIMPGRKEKCGFVRINFESVVPYCIKDDQKYVPLFYFEGETENLRAVKLENWDLAYLKFCCKVQGIRNEFFASDSCIVTSLEDLKNHFPPETNFEEYWPAKVVDPQLLTNQKRTHVNAPGAWIRAPPSALRSTVVASDGILSTQPPLPPHPLPLVTAPPVIAPPYGVPVLSNNSYQNGGWTTNQMGSTVLQQNGMPPPPWVQANNSAPASNSGSHSNIAPMNSQPMTSMYSSMPSMYSPMVNSSSSLSHSNQMRQYLSSQRTGPGNGPVQQHQLQSQQQQQQFQQQQQRQQQAQNPHQQIVNTLLGGQTYNTHSTAGSSSNGRITNTQQRNALRSMPIVAGPPFECIVLSSPSSSSTPQQMTQEIVRPNNAPSNNVANNMILQKIPERNRALDVMQRTPPYQIHKATLLGKVIHCINSKAHVHSQSDLMVTLDDLVQVLIPTCDVWKCANILSKYLKTTLYSGNSEQKALLRKNGRIRSFGGPNDPFPMTSLSDITLVALQLQVLVAEYDELQQHYQQTGMPAKRQRF